MSFLGRNSSVLYESRGGSTLARPVRVGQPEEKSKHVNAGPTLIENTPTWVQYRLNARQATAQKSVRLFSLFGRKRSTTAWELQKVNMKPIYGQLSANIVTARRDKLERRSGEKLKTATCGQHRKGICRHGFNIGPTQGRVPLRGVGYRCCIMAYSNSG